MADGNVKSIRRLVVAGLVGLVLLVGCGGANDRGEPGYDGYEVAEAPEHEPAPEQTPAPASTPVATPTPRGNRFVFESGFLGTKFSVIQPQRFRFWGHNRVHRDEALLRNWEGEGLINIWQGVTHPSEWSRVFADEIQSGERQELWLQDWVQPEEPAEVFVNGSGLTVVKYMHEHERTIWGEDSPRDNTIVIFRVTTESKQQTPNDKPKTIR